MSALTWTDIAPTLRQYNYQLPSFSTAASVITRDDIVMSAGDLNACYPLASVTKLLTTWAVLIAADQGLVELDSPVVLPGVPVGVTLRHLLAHASGAPMEAGAPFQALRMRRQYSNWGIELAAAWVESALGGFEGSQMSLGEWLRERVCEPLGMMNTHLQGSAAHGGVSTVADLQRFAREVMSPRLLSASLSHEAFRPHFPELAGIVPGYGRFTPCLWGLGFEVRGAKEHWMPANSSPETVGHFGQAGSYLWVDHSRELAGIFLGEQTFGQWHKENWGRLNTAIVQIADSVALSAATE